MGESTYEVCQRIVAEGTGKQVSVGMAESCTGGLVCAALTDVPGSSSVVRGGIVSYAVPVKERVLGVGDNIIQGTGMGVVSSECARAMCEGAKDVLECDIAVSVTGIAGPGGAEPGKPVGTVWFGITGPHGTKTVHRLFGGSRREVREQAVRQALALVLSEIENL